MFLPIHTALPLAESGQIHILAVGSQIRAPRAPDVPTLAELEAAAAFIRPHVPPTPQYVWPLLSARAGCTVWVKHENHTPIGAFKVRGGLVYLADLKKREPGCRGVIAATRGNHGQSVAFAARQCGLRAVIVVPHGNSVEKNAAMRALGGELIEHGHDFQEALEYAQKRAAIDDLHMLPSFHRLLVQGVGTYGLELLHAAPGLDTVYVPIGLGSGICGVIAARDALQLRTKIVGVVAAQAPCYALSFAAGAVKAVFTAGSAAISLVQEKPTAPLTTARRPRPAWKLSLASSTTSLRKSMSTEWPWMPKTSASSAPSRSARARSR